jgi:hypothetical protein
MPGPAHDCSTVEPGTDGEALAVPPRGSIILGESPFAPGRLPRARPGSSVPPHNSEHPENTERPMTNLRWHRRTLAAVVFTVAATVPGPPASAQQPQQRTPPAARPADVASMDAIIAAVYDVISGPAGQKRDWQRFESLFVPGARLIPTAVRSDGTAVARVLSPSEYAANADSVLTARGFFEREDHRVAESFGRIAHAFSTYESRWTPTDEKPFQRGINSFQLLNDGRRWWIVSIYWDAERPDNPIPAKYLGNDGR